MAQNQSFEVFRGEDIRLDFTLTPLTDITGWTLVFTMRKRRVLTDLLIAQINGVIISAVAGTFTVNIPALSLIIAPDIYEYDVWRTNIGSEAVLTEGQIKVKPEVRK